MQCSRCNATSSTKATFTIPAGTIKTQVTLYQCRACQNVDVEVKVTGD